VVELLRCYSSKKPSERPSLVAVLSTADATGLLCSVAAGEWWVELLRFYSSKELRLLAKAADARLHLPPDFQLSYELLRGMAHEHVRLRQVQGE
jgi:hypothetical protein